MTTPTPPATASDARWLALADAELVDDLLTPAEREFLASHAARSPAVRAEQQARRDLATHGRDDVVDAAADEAIITAAVGRFLEDEAPAAAPIALAPRRRTRWLVVGLALAASVALAWISRSMLMPGPAPRASDPLTVLSGAPRTAAGQAVPGDILASRAELQTDDAPACVGADEHQRVCLAPHSRARAAADGALELLAGSAEITVTSGVHTFAVVVAGVRLTSDDGAFTVTVTSDRWTAAATRGAVQLADADGPLARLTAGDRLSRGLGDPSAPVPADIPAPPVPSDSPPPPVPPDSQPPAAAPVPADSPPTPGKRPPRSDAPPAAELLAEAREHRAAGRTREAVRAYQRLISGHPGSPLAGTAQLALGQLFLGPAGDPKAALRAFDAYLALGGPLAEEASHGRIQALQRLGRTAEVRAAIDRFLARYPASSYADALRRQVDP